MENSESEYGEAPFSRVAVGIAGLAVAILLFNVALTCYDVLMRWLLNQPQSWVSDFSELTYPLAIVCCFPVAVESGSMIVIRIMASLRNPIIAKAADAFGQVALAAMLCLFTWKVFWRAVSDWITGYATTLIKLPIGPTWFAVAAILAIATVMQIKRSWLVITGRIDNA